MGEKLHMKVGEKTVKFVPYTPAGTALDWLVADTEDKAWKNLLKDAAHMPYKGIEGFKKRGYRVDREEWTLLQQ